MDIASNGKIKNSRLLLLKIGFAFYLKESTNV